MNTGCECSFGERPLLSMDSRAKGFVMVSKSPRHSF